MLHIFDRLIFHDFLQLIFRLNPLTLATKLLSGSIISLNVYSQNIVFYKEPKPKLIIFSHSLSYQVEGITDKLLDTFRGNPDEDWWSKVIAERSYGSGRSEFKGIFKARCPKAGQAELLVSGMTNWVSR